jgi:metal-responsive CopG/Arc/MetJ family transcriptional regulator
MKQKTSITLSPETLEAVDRLTGAGSNRSRVIEQAVLEFIRRQEKMERDQRELASLNAIADDLNEEMEDVLTYQVDP